MRILKLLFLLVLLVPSMPSLAQESSRSFIRIGVPGDVTDFGQLLPQTCRSAYTCEIADIIFPRLIGVDPTGQYFAPNAAANALTEHLEVSRDGLEYTFRLRDDMYWSDGTQIDADDVVFSFQATGFFGSIYDVQAEDSFTVTVYMQERSCTALFNMDIGIIPAHAFDSDPNQVSNSSFGLSPDITSGPFLLDRLDTDANRLILRANPNYAVGEVQSGGLILVGTEDQEAAVNRFLAGELDIINVIPQSRFQELRATPGIQFFAFASTSWDYIALNLGDPAHPRDGRDAEGDLQDQGIHPIFSDVLVRRALQHALNVPAIIELATFGEATIMPSYESPLSWAFDPNLQPVPFDRKAADRLLEEAGWVTGPGGIRIASSSAYAQKGTRLSFTLVTNSGNSRRVAIAEAVREQLQTVGVEVQIEVIDFEKILNLTDSQTFDAILSGWRNAIPDNPTPNMFLPGNDFAGTYGANFVSYQNNRIVELEADADFAANCEPAARALIYHEIQAVVQQDQPFLWLFALNQAYAAQANVQNFQPHPNMFYYNSYLWSLDE